MPDEKKPVEKKQIAQTNPTAIVEKTGGQGRPAYTNEQYLIWLNEMRSWLELGQSLNYACNMAGIASHYTVIMEKYKSEAWFSNKVDALRATPGELINNTVVLEVKRINTKVKQGLEMDRDEIQLIKLAAEKHRSAQPFFVTRIEAAPSDDKNIGKILDVIETEVDDYEEVAKEAKKQVVANDAPVQNQGQTGEVSNIQAENTTAQAPSGETQPPV